MSKTQQRERQQKPQGQCIFCQGHGMTKQHIWPNWISRSEIAAKSNTAREANNTQNLQNIRLEYDPNNKLTTVIPVNKNIIHQGSRLSRKVRMVCAKCNNEWMSIIENKCKELVIALQSFKNVKLNYKNQLDLATWITILTVIAEFTDVPSKRIPVKERRDFYENKTPIEGWQIWIGKYNGTEWDLRYQHRGKSMGASGIKDGMGEKEDIFEASAQCSTFVMGGLAIFVVSPGIGLNPDYFSSSYINNMAKIWPASEHDIDWQLLTINSDADINEQANTFSDEMQNLYFSIMKALNENEKGLNA